MVYVVNIVLWISAPTTGADLTGERAVVSAEVRYEDMQQELFAEDSPLYDDLQNHIILHKLRSWSNIGAGIRGVSIERSLMDNNDRICIKLNNGKRLDVKAGEIFSDETKAKLILLA